MGGQPAETITWKAESPEPCSQPPIPTLGQGKGEEGEGAGRGEQCGEGELVGSKETQFRDLR